MNVKNGLIRLRDRKLLPHCPRYLSATQLPISYDEKATCPNIDNFVAQVFPDDAIELAYEIPGWLMLAITTIQKAILFFGAGGNGKSVYLNLICRFLGKENYSSLALHKLESDRFAASRLIGKLANICADLPTNHLAGTSVFKAITGGDTITAEYKFRDSFDFEPCARLVFSSNALPQSNDQSPGFFDRWLVVPFERSFRGTGQEIPKAELDARLTSDTELSGLLNKAIDAIHVVKSRNWRLHSSQTLVEAHREFHSVTDPLGVWLDGFTVDDPMAVTPKAILRSAYGSECERKGRPLLTDRAFGLAVQQHRPTITTAQRTAYGRLQWCYIGLGMRTDDTATSQHSQLIDREDHSRDSQHSQLNPNLLLPTNRVTIEDGIDVETSRGQAVNPVKAMTPDYEKPRKNRGMPNWDEINLLLSADSEDGSEVEL